MSDRVSAQERVGASPETVCDVITAWGTSGAKEIRRSEILEGERGSDAVVEYELEGFGRRIVYVLRYEVQRPERVDFALVRSNLLRRMDGAYVLSPDGDATLVDYSMEADLKVPLPGFLKRQMGRRIVESSLGELKARAEGTA